MADLQPPSCLMVMATLKVMATLRVKVMLKVMVKARLRQPQAKAPVKAIWRTMGREMVKG